MTDNTTDPALRALDRDEAIEKALLYVFQLSNKDYRTFQTALSESAFVRALEQDGYTIAALAAAPLDVEGLAEAMKSTASERTRLLRWEGSGDGTPDADFSAHARIIAREYAALAATSRESGSNGE